MLRQILGILLVLLNVTAGLQAAEIKGKIKSVDPDKRTVLMTVAGKDREFSIDPDTKVTNAAGKDVKEPFTSKTLQSGANVTITTSQKDGREVVNAVKVVASPNKPAETFTDPSKSGPDFLIQGEYEGEVKGQGRLGAQVVAMGEGKFNASLLPGGLPGAGWNAKDRIKLTGQADKGKTSLAGESWSTEIADGKLEGKSPQGHAFTLKRVVRKSPREGAKPPPAAIILFDGTNADEWNGGKLVEGNLLNPGVTTKKSFKDFQLHVEFYLPFKPLARGQSRANSGVYLQQRYEIQVLDSFGLEGKNNECGAIYTLVAPAVNMCFPPLSWQTYDIEFKAARFDPSGKKTGDAVISVIHNGVKVHDRVAVKGPTGHGLKEEDTPRPINFQNHGNPVYFRNVWLVPGDS